jgi:hypothetical protein
MVPGQYFQRHKKGIALGAGLGLAAYVYWNRGYANKIWELAQQKDADYKNNREKQELLKRQEQNRERYEKSQRENPSESGQGWKNDTSGTISSDDEQFRAQRSEEYEKVFDQLKRMETYRPSLFVKKYWDKVHKLNPFDKDKSPQEAIEGLKKIGEEIRDSYKDIQ